MEFFETIKQIKSNWNPYQKWAIEQQKKEKQNEELRKKYPPTSEELAYARQYGRTIVDVINTMDQHSIDKSEDANNAIGYVLAPLEMTIAALGLGLGKVLKTVVDKSKFKEKLKNYKSMWGLIGVIILSAISLPPIQIYQSKVTKQASRIARFQTRENDLKDSRNFVIYNEQQINEAEEIAKTLPEIKENRKDKFTKDTFNPLKSIQKAMNTITALNKDDAKYLKWKEEYLKSEEQKKELFKTISPSARELSKAEKDRDVMLNIIQKIENNSLEYLNNMQMASILISKATSLVSMGIGTGGSLLLNKLVKNKKVAARLTPIPFILSIFPPLIILSPINKMVKNAARIGRFKTKQELLNNPQNFIAYDEKHKQSIPVLEVQNQKTKGLFKRFTQDLKALKQLQKDSKEYDNYMNTKHKEELKLQEALKQVKISGKQEIEATEIQKKAFHSFEKMDEKAQRFTDDSEAAIDSVGAVVFSLINLFARVSSIAISGEELTRINNGVIPQKFRDIFKIIFSKKITAKVGIGLLIPYFIPPLIKVPMVVKGVQIKKDAGKIGVMTAINDLNDPKNFLDSAPVKM